MENSDSLPNLVWKRIISLNLEDRSLKESFGSGFDFDVTRTEQVNKIIEKSGQTLRCRGNLSAMEVRFSKWLKC